MVLDGPLSSTPLAWKVFRKTTRVPCQSARNHTMSDPPEIAIDTPKHDFKPTRVSFGWFLAFQKVLQTSSRHSCSLLETAAATTDDTRKHNFRHPQCLFGWSIDIQTCILKVFAVDISKHGPLTSGPDVSRFCRSAAAGVGQFAQNITRSRY